MVASFAAVRLFIFGSTKKLRGHCPRMPPPWLRACGWVQGNGSRAVLPLTRHQCGIHCKSSFVVHGVSKRKRTPQTTRDSAKGYKSEYKGKWTQPHLL